MKVIIELVEEVKERYLVEFDGDLANFDPIEHMVDKNMVNSKVSSADYDWYLIGDK